MPLAIADTIDKIMAHLRPKALEALLVNCVKEEGNLGLSDALVLCIERLEEDLRDNPDPPIKRHRYRSARASLGDRQQTRTGKADCPAFSDNPQGVANLRQSLVNQRGHWCK